MDRLLAGPGCTDVVALLHCNVVRAKRFPGMATVTNNTKRFVPFMGLRSISGPPLFRTRASSSTRRTPATAGASSARPSTSASSTSTGTSRARPRHRPRPSQARLATRSAPRLPRPSAARLARSAPRQRGSRRFGGPQGPCLNLKPGRLGGLVCFLGVACDREVEWQRAKKDTFRIAGYRDRKKSASFS